MLTPEAINDFFSFLYTGWIGTLAFWLRLIAGILTAAMFAAVVVISMKLNIIKRMENERYRRSLGLADGQAMPSDASAIAAPEPVSAPWRNVEEKIQSMNPADWNMAVIQADAVFDGVLKDMQLPGSTFADRLRNLDTAKLASLNDVWEAHKLRNRIAHETDRTLTHDEARRAVDLFAKGLREMQYLPEEE
ncbi:hypothetical protein C4552_00725 [Candidatus Parcubacteria bacterium]|nr:MAG: hypothetical protein C4552_00725 [Candidatus Parcubacteria bacterium]